MRDDLKKLAKESKPTRKQMKERRVAEYVRAEVLPWAGAFERQRAGDFRMVIGSDFHGLEVDGFAMATFLDVIKRVKPEVIVLNGDVVDFGAVSSWPKNPNSRRLLDLEKELTFTKRQILEPVRAAAPDAQIDLVVGNHEFSLIRYLADPAPALASLKCLSIGSLLGLKESRINLVMNDALLAPDESSQRRQVRQSWKVYGGCFVVTHGSKAGKFPADKELARFGMSGCSGHVHRPQYHSTPTLQNPYADWFCTGMMATNEIPDGEGHGANFKSGPSSWTVGFAVVSIYQAEGVAIPQQVIFKNGVAEFAGITYRRDPPKD